jgi:sugar (pentulose or hexulose) kinase
MPSTSSHALPDVYEKTSMFLPARTTLNLRLTGHFGATCDSVHLFWLTDIRDPEHPLPRRRTIIALSGIEKAKLPPLSHPTDVIGHHSGPRLRPPSPAPRGEGGGRLPRSPSALC